eukprot:m.79481 g.79481  ORF g.79481 m.79481 type:complete len:66 (-) comp16271_c0_seq6:1592-1789(-)
MRALAGRKASGCIASHGVHYGGKMKQQAAWRRKVFVLVSVPMSVLHTCFRFSAPIDGNLHVALCI